MISSFPLVVYHSRPGPHYTDVEIAVHEMRDNIPPLLQQHFDKLSAATFPIFHHEQVASHAVAISATLLFTTGPFHEGNVVRAAERRTTVIFDGSQDGYPFQILELDEPVSEWLLLDGSGSEEQSLQICYREHTHQADTLRQMGTYHHSGITTSAPNGTPCMSLYYGRLHAIHQGEYDRWNKPALFNVNDIYNCLVKVASTCLERERRNTAIEILSRLEERSFTGRGIDSLSEENRAPRPDLKQNVSTVRCSFALETVIDDVCLPILFNYDEIKKENGSRQIKIWQQNILNGHKYVYNISPSPCDAINYQQHGLPELHHMLAESLGRNYLATNEYPQTLSVAILDQKFRLEQEPVPCENTDEFPQEVAELGEDSPEQKEWD